MEKMVQEEIARLKASSVSFGDDYDDDDYSNKDEEGVGEGDEAGGDEQCEHDGRADTSPCGDDDVALAAQPDIDVAAAAGAPTVAVVECDTPKQSTVEASDRAVLSPQPTRDGAPTSPSTPDGFGLNPSSLYVMPHACSPVVCLTVLAICA
jgi:hypothetical protein